MIIIPHEVINMNQKRKIIHKNINKYRKASRKKKKIILNQLCEVTGYTRKYVTMLLNAEKKQIVVDKKTKFKADITKNMLPKSSEALYKSIAKLYHPQN